MVSDMFNRQEYHRLWHTCMKWGANRVHRLMSSCTKKCVPSDYREAELNKGEGVCLDRCVAKFFEVNVKVSEKMQGISAQQGGGGGGGAMFGR